MKPMTRADQKAATRRRVLAAATRLVGKHGFAGTRTSDVARATRLSHGAVFVHFPSREALDLAVAAELGRVLTDRLHALGSAGGSFRDALIAHVKCLEEHEGVYARLLTEGPTLPRGFTRTWTAIQSAVSHHLSHAAAPEMKSGRLRPMPMHLLFNTWIGLVHHYLINRQLFAPNGSVMAKHGRMLVDHYVALVAPLGEE
jgi:AcrR family transcriptional regulator